MDSAVFLSAQYDFWCQDVWPAGEGEDVEFTLVYEGPLYAHNDTRFKADHKHAIRTQLHPQLRRLWEMKLPHWMNSTRVSAMSGKYLPGDPVYLQVADDYTRSGIRFVPLVADRLMLACKMDILFLRKDAGLGKIIQSGDIDNRLKTLFDALRVPKQGNEMGNAKLDPSQDPLFVLLQDDELITEIAVRADTLLTDDAAGYTKVIMRVTVRPLQFNEGNADFA